MGNVASRQVPGSAFYGCAFVLVRERSGSMPTQHCTHCRPVRQILSIVTSRHSFDMENEVKRARVVKPGMHVRLLKHAFPNGFQMFNSK